MSSKASKRSKLAELRALRQAGKKTFDTYEVEQEDSLYEEVDEDSYKKIVRERLNQDDFVVDDNGEGYADDGREDWDRVPVYYESDIEDGAPAQVKTSKAAKRVRDEEQAKRDANDRDISEYFSKGASTAQPKSKAIKTEDDEKFLADLLGEVDTNVRAPIYHAPKKTDNNLDRRRARALSPGPDVRLPLHKKVKVVDDRPASRSPWADEDDSFVPVDDEVLPAPAEDFPMIYPSPSSPAAKAVERKAQGDNKNPEDVKEDEDNMEVLHAGATKASSVNLAASRPVKKTIKFGPLPELTMLSPIKGGVSGEVDASSWNSITQGLNVVSSASETRTVGKMDWKNATEADGSLRFFWTDYTEVNGSLCLFGKVLDKSTRIHVSCFVKVDNILRKLYFLPREKRYRDGEECPDEPVQMMDVYTEVDDIMTKMKVEMHKIKACTRKYAFELPDVPKEGKYLKLLYPYTRPQLDPDRSGETYSRIFGTNTSLFEQLVLLKNIMGPCWLKISDAVFDSIQNASHCRLEVSVKHPDQISVKDETADLPDTPPLTIMSLALRTTFNAKENKQEILAISARVYENVSLEETVPAEKLPCRTFTMIRPYGAAFPIGFEALAKDKRRIKGLVKTVKQESEMLSFFLAQVDVADPDVIVGHQLEGVDYSVLLNRLSERKIHQWSRLGRLRRSNWPSSMGKMGGNVFAERQILTGRLLCDLANDAGKSVMTKCQSWSLTEMCNLYLGSGGAKNNSPRRLDIDNEAALKTWAGTKDGLMDYVTHIEADTYFIAALALRTQILPLTKVLTNLAGNSWARTLTGTRAERNEYILLHEFHRNKYICPDKKAFKGRPRAGEEDEDGQAGEAGKKKDKYKGGLVFEPEKGLYDKFVLVMDFNSLYPSIIQEYNICFTTVDRESRIDDEEDAVPKLPPAGLEQGILPKLIATLVGRRRQVKSLMKDKSATSEQLATWDVKQLALKLTANSMYGCLGYTKSRFYARPLAILTTFKGREILRSTKELAETNSLQVIYGDTDSVMINANVDSVAAAFRVGQEFKRAVNERYRLLEIDIDNVFRRILLQAKKKYAAINMVEVDGKFVEKMEVKGLDMRRREYCALSKEISARILDEILSGEETEASVARIHEYLRNISVKMRAQEVPPQKYIIFTQLGKAPKEYPNADSMPQVQVALRELARGKTVRKGDVISYIITSGSEPAATRAHTPADVLKPDSGMSPDIEWYMAKQIFPPIERLCANIFGTSTAQLAENLGLDTHRYAPINGQSKGFGNGEADTGLEIHPLESQMPDEVRFRNCSRLELQCRVCKATSIFDGLQAANAEDEKHSRVTPSGVACGSCAAPIPPISVIAQVERAIRLTTARYYEGWLVCDDTSCGARTMQMSVYGSRCLGPKGLALDCMGRMRYEFGERDLYNQLVYFASLFDVERARARGFKDEESKERLLALAEHNRVRFGTIKAAVNLYLDKCGRQWVAMDNLFTKLGFAITA